MFSSTSRPSDGEGNEDRGNYEPDCLDDRDEADQVDHQDGPEQEDLQDEPGPSAIHRSRSKTKKGNVFAPNIKISILLLAIQFITFSHQITGKSKSRVLDESIASVPKKRKSLASGTRRTPKDKVQTTSSTRFGDQPTDGTKKVTFSHQNYLQ